MLEGPQLGAALRDAISKKSVTQGQVAAAFGVRQASVSEWLKHGRIAKKHLNHLVDWFRDVVGPEHWGLSPAFAQAQTVSQWNPTVALPDASPVVMWGSMNKDDLPELFQVEVPDDAMADRVLKGHLVKFDKRLEPRPGDGVLVADAAGAWHFRQYAPGTQGRFSAVAKNSAYQTLDSERDGLKVLAVLVGVPAARWG